MALSPKQATNEAVGSRAGSSDFESASERSPKASEALHGSPAKSPHSKQGEVPSPLSNPELPAIEVRSLSRRYGRHWVLINLSLKIPQGVVCLVAGHNGSGKSTLFRVLAGALRPHHGSVEVMGHDAQAERTGLRQQVALLGHHSYTYDILSARQNLSAFARLAGTFESREQIDKSLAEVGLAGRGDDSVETFSAGMRKRIAFARLLLQRPKVVLLDEPYGALDPAGFEFVDHLIQRLKSQGVTVLIASHLVEHVAARSDLAVMLERGHLVSFGPARELLEKKGRVQSSSPSPRESRLQEEQKTAAKRGGRVQREDRGEERGEGKAEDAVVEDAGENGIEGELQSSTKGRGRE